MKHAKLSFLAARPALYTPGTAVMWTDPYISRKLLEFHLNPEIDAASRGPESIDRTVEWIQVHVGPSPRDILDLGCGPGLYAERLSALGHRVTGVDYSINSLEYARAQTAQNRTGITYLHTNYLDLDFTEAFDMAMIIYTDFCVLFPEDQKKFLANVWRALRPGGVFLCDVTNTRNLEAKVMPESRECCPSDGFWRKGECLVLSRGYLYPENSVLLEQRIVIEPDDRLETYHFWHKCFEPETLVPLFEQYSFRVLGHREDVLPQGTVWSGENISFYAAEKI